MKEQEVARNDADVCPVCGKESVDGGFVEVSQIAAHQECSCMECGAVWQERFKLDSCVITDRGSNA